MPASPLLYEFRRELPFYLRCTPWTAEKSYYAVRAFLRRQAAPFPECFTRDAVVEHLSFLATTPPQGRDRERRAASTVNETLKALKRFGRWAVAREKIAVNPTEDLKGLRAVEPVILAPEPPVVASMLSMAREWGETPEIRLRNHAAVCFLVDTGVRAAELLAMDMADLKEGMAVIHGKAGRDRLVSINPAVLTALGLYMDARRPRRGERAVWLAQSGYRWTYPALRNVVQNISRDLGVRVNLHDLRRFAHTQLWMSDISQIDGMLISGHSDPQVYQRYIRAAMQLRALREHRARSPLDALLTP